MPPTLSRPALALCAALFLVQATGALALDLGVDLGGVDVDVSIGGDSGVGVGVGFGDADVGVGVGGDGTGLGVDIDVDLDGDGVPETNARGLTIRPLGQEGALDAVRSNRALPLEEILSRARLLADGEVIDAQLIEVRRILVYEIKVLGRGGDVQDLYFYARSGAPVTPR